MLCICYKYRIISGIGKHLLPVLAGIYFRSWRAFTSGFGRSKGLITGRAVVRKMTVSGFKTVNE